MVVVPLCTSPHPLASVIVAVIFIAVVALAVRVMALPALITTDETVGAEFATITWLVIFAANTVCKNAYSPSVKIDTGINNQKLFHVFSRKNFITYNIANFFQNKAVDK